jgi:hypothetical protein
MFVRLIQATAITLALYGLGLNNLQASMAKSNETTDIAEAVVEPSEMLVALKQALAGDE